MKYDIYFIGLGFMLSYLDSKFKGKTKCVPAVDDFIDYEIPYKNGCVVISGRVVSKTYFLQDDKVELAVEITEDNVLKDLREYIVATGKVCN